MTAIDNQHPRPMVKILFQPNDDHYTSTETLWAEDLGNHRYRLQNSPWYIYGISFEDIVRASPGEDGMLEFVEVVQRSGTSTFRLLLRDGVGDDQFVRHWQPLEALGCTRERAKGGFYAVNAPADVDLNKVAEHLSSGRDHGVWDWETGYWHATPTPTAAMRQSRRSSRPERRS